MLREPSRARLARCLALTLTAALGSLSAENVDPDADGSRYAWGENVGWINAEPGGDGGPGAEVANFALSGWLWGENVGWISLSCHNTSSCGTTDYGVTNDGHGALGGFAWSENAGWLAFAHAAESARIDPGTGTFAGWVWSENLGWISLSCTNTVTCDTTEFGIETAWCRSVPAAPPGSPGVAVAKSGNDVELSWAPLSGAAWYEIVRGRLAELVASGGDFAAATDGCASDNVSDTLALVTGEPPLKPGSARWYLVRGANCKGKGTYDSGGLAQVEERDAGIAASGQGCP